METKPEPVDLGVDRTPVNLDDVAQAMLTWKKLQGEADWAAEAVKREVLRLKETVTTGTVRATYSRGRKSYDYKIGASRVVPDTEWPGLVEEHTRTVKTVDWRSICYALNITDIPFTQAEPSVSIKIIE